MSANNPNDGRAVHTPMLKTIASLVVIVASLAFLFVRLPPKIEEAPHVGIGQKLAEQAGKSLGSGGKIVLIAPDRSVFRYPGFEIQLKAFHAALRKARLTVSATNLIKLDPLYLVRVPSGDFANILRKQSDGDVVVSLLGPPILTAEQKSKLPPRHPRVVAVCSGDLPLYVNLKGLFDDDLLHAAIISRPSPSPAPRTGSSEDSFNHFYHLITAANTSDLPAPLRAANP
jgi:hypothetical protein